MSAYVHGGDIYSAKQRIQGEILDFSANINPLGLPRGVKDAIIANIEQYHHYPDSQCRQLRDAIANDQGVAAEAIICGNGAADLIFRLIQALKPRKAMVLAPTFAAYEQALNTVNCEVQRYFLQKECQFQYDGTLANQLDSSIEILFLCNPNNPTGQVVEQCQLLPILQRCHQCGIVLVIDECFMDFLEGNTNYTMKQWLIHYPKLIILKAFTKYYAMAGLRLGYMMCYDQRILEEMYQNTQAWPVSSVAQVAGVQALQEESYRQKTAQWIQEQRIYLTQQLKQCGFQVIGSKSNYIFFYDLQQRNWCQILERYGILIRNCDNYHGLSSGYYRIAVKSKEHNQQLITVIKQLIG